MGKKSHSVLVNSDILCYLSLGETNVKQVTCCGYLCRDTAIVFNSMLSEALYRIFSVLVLIPLLANISRDLKEDSASCGVCMGLILGADLLIEHPARGIDSVIRFQRSVEVSQGNLI
jgi:hypothetical protein